MTAPSDEVVARGTAVGAPTGAANAPATAVATYRAATIAAAVIVALLLPLVAKSFVTFQLTQVMVYALAILGLNLLTGYNGQFSLGHSAFYGIGAYTAAIMMAHWDMPYYSTIPAAGAVCFVVGFLFGLPALRLQGLYLALATFALAIAMPQILKFHPLEGFTGGVQGIAIVKPDPPFGLPLDADQWLYYFTLAVLLLLLAGNATLAKSRSGRALMAIRDNPIAAVAMGINTALYKTLAFGISALVTGIAGALGAIVVQFVAPDSFSFLLSISFLVGLVIGGVGSIPGCLVGGLFVLYVPNIAESISTGSAGVIYGVILLFVIYVIPTGAAGIPKLVRTGYSAPTLDRPQFFATWACLSAVLAFILYMVHANVSGQPAIRILDSIFAIIALPLQLFLIVKRLRDIQWPAWCCILFLVPVVNIGFVIVLFFAKGRRMSATSLA